MTPLEKSILAGVLTRRETILKWPWDTSTGPERLIIQDARRGLVATAHAPWASGLSVAGRKATSRAYASLQAAGLLLRHGTGKTTALALTAAGEAAARKLLKG